MGWRTIPHIPIYHIYIYIHIYHVSLLGETELTPTHRNVCEKETLKPLVKFNQIAIAYSKTIALSSSLDFKKEKNITTSWQKIKHILLKCF